MTTPLYSELNEIELQFRLLTIEPSQELEEPLKCSMHTMSLREAPQYYALSYLWGNKNVTDKVSVNGIEVAVTVNLIAAFRQLRASSPRSLASCKIDSEDTEESPTKPRLDLPRYLWADAICINEKSMKERAWQVKLMGRIYRNASKVIAWLGPEAENSAQAIKPIRLIVKEVPQIVSQHDIANWLRHYPGIFGRPDIWKAIRSLFDRDFWKRTWIIQELVLNDNVTLLCGSEGLDMVELFNRFGDEASRTRDANPAMIPSLYFGEHIDCIILLGIRQHNSSYQRHRFHFYPLEQARRTRATDARDKVYALLGLTELAVEPDYSCSVSTVYTRTAIEYLQQEGLSGCFGNAGNGLRNISEVPSWVPDWSFERWLGWDFFERWTGVETDAYDDNHFRVDSNNSRILHVFGFQVAKVEALALSPPKRATEHSAAVWFTQFTLAAIERYASGFLATRVPIIQAALRLLVCDGNILSPESMRPRLRIPSHEFFILADALLKVLCCHMEEGFDLKSRDWTRNIPKLGISIDQSFVAQFCEHFGGDKSILCPWKSIEEAVAAIDDGMCHRLMARIVTSLEYSRLFYTTPAFLGSGPCNVETNDMVFVLKGCKMPVLLRKVDSHYELVGPSQIPGIMDGELFKDPSFRPKYEDIELH
ncbi:hypothetical protein LTR70_000782 [Exophiala xenobiotica]|uniref:Heterokaryon incompatibility domain-containing protein n=1 Tax=Lithohypha guttulata TaxID=1690604 RepID=A0ABR0KN69_9EURO|nr:hypothetical protein LTR24_000545 [Lithohypha guttulata]KAK5329285.1 hypothetical protein LTR70_000782 [Exophiala xenobiotica]